MPAPAWSRGPDTTEANGVDYGSDFDGPAVAVTDGVGRVYCIAQSSSTNVYLRLDPPYTRWFTMTPAPDSTAVDFPVVLNADDKLIIVPSQGIGGNWYDPTLDDGYLLGGGNEPPDSPHPDPWAHARLPATPTDWPAWVALFDVTWDGSFGYAAGVVTPAGRAYVFGNRVNSQPGHLGNFSGFLGPDDYWHKIADLPVGEADITWPTGDPYIEGHSACVDSAGIPYVGGGLTVDVVANRFRRYIAGPPIGAGVSEIQQVTVDDPTPGWGDYFLCMPFWPYDEYFQIVEGDDLVTMQAASDAYFAALTIPAPVLSGIPEELVFTWADDTMHPLISQRFLGGATYITAISLQHGSGFPSTDAWEELDPIPGDSLFRGVMIANGTDIHYIGGHDGIDPVGTHYRWREAGGWQELLAIPDGLTTVSTVNTSGDSQPGFLVDGRLVVFAYSADSLQCAIVSFDLANERWGAPIYTEVNHQRGGFALTDTHAIIMGGTDDAGNPTSAVERIRVADLAAFGGLHLAELSWRSEA